MLILYSLKNIQIFSLGNLRREKYIEKNKHQNMLYIIFKFLNFFLQETLQILIQY